MPTLTAAEIYNVCLQAGFTPDQAVTWTAIALAESGGNTGAHNPNGEDSRGLWQINIDPSVRDNPWGDLSDPVANARAAYEISQGGTDMRPWTVTHARNAGTNKDYRQHMAEAQAAAGGAYHGDFSGVSGYDDPSPMGADEPGGSPGPAAPAPAPAPAAAPPPAPAPEPDADRDGAPDAFEMSSGTDPQIADTDLDGLTDGFELAHGSNALVVDTDTDGLSDAFETDRGSDPLVADTDADGLGDAQEVALGRDPGLGVAPAAAGPAVDADADGLSDGIEAALGTNALLADTDGDRVADSVEHAQGSDALLFDSDHDGIVDGVDADAMVAQPGLAPPGAVPPGALPGAVPGALAGMPFAPGAMPGADPTDPSAVAGLGGAPAPATAAAPAPAAAPPPAADPDNKVQQFLDMALAQTGDSYVFGSEASVDDADPGVFDCSELIQWAGGRVGVEMPDGSWLQYLELERQGAVIPVEQAANTPGALLFSFDREPTAGGGRPGQAHVAISLGDGTTIEARGTRYGVGSWETGDRFQYAAVIPGLGGGSFTPPADAAAAAVASAPAPAPAPAPDPDADMDGAGDSFEMAQGLDPMRPDSDSDGLTDGFELVHLTDGLSMDGDHDGLSDTFEVQSHLDPMRADSDGDGLTDGYELAALGDPGTQGGLATIADPTTAPAGIADGDGDGLSDAWESTLGTNPLHADTDGDGIVDSLEVARATDPVAPGELTDPDRDPDEP